MLELGSSGSVRGVSSNGHPYRDPRSIAVDSTVESKWLGLGSGKSLPDYFLGNFQPGLQGGTRLYLTSHPPTAL